MLEEVFETFDLKAEETKTYVALLETGATSAGVLAKSLGMKRPTVYGYLERLVNTGLVVQSVRHGVKMFVPEPAETIRELYKRKIDDLQARKKSLDHIIPELNEKAGLNLMRPRIQYFEGREGLEKAFQDPLTHPGCHILSFWSIQAAIDATSEDFFWWLNKERIKRDVYLSAIWPPSQAVDVKRYPFMGTGEDFKREIRIAPDEVDSSTGYWIYANKVLFASPRAESFSYIIESADLVEMMSNQHRLIWNLSKPITPSAEDMKPFLDDLNNPDDYEF